MKDILSEQINHEMSRTYGGFGTSVLWEVAQEPNRKWYWAVYSAYTYIDQQGGYTTKDHAKVELLRWLRECQNA